MLIYFSINLFSYYYIEVTTLLPLYLLLASASTTPKFQTFFFPFLCWKWKSIPHENTFQNICYWWEEERKLFSDFCGLGSMLAMESFWIKIFKGVVLQWLIITTEKHNNCLRLFFFSHTVSTYHVSLRIKLCNHVNLDQVNLLSKMMQLQSLIFFFRCSTYRPYYQPSYFFLFKDNNRVWFKGDLEIICSRIHDYIECPACPSNISIHLIKYMLSWLE